MFELNGRVVVCLHYLAICDLELKLTSYNHLNHVTLFHI